MGATLKSPPLLKPHLLAGVAAPVGPEQCRDRVWMFSFSLQSVGSMMAGTLFPGFGAGHLQCSHTITEKTMLLSVHCSEHC